MEPVVFRRKKKEKKTYLLIELNRYKNKEALKKIRKGCHKKVDSTQKLPKATAHTGCVNNISCKGLYFFT
jgi:hypothetical protein